MPDETFLIFKSLKPAIVLYCVLTVPFTFHSALSLNIANWFSIELDVFSLLICVLQAVAFLIVCHSAWMCGCGCRLNISEAKWDSGLFPIGSLRVGAQGELNGHVTDAIT